MMGQAAAAQVAVYQLAHLSSPPSQALTSRGQSQHTTCMHCSTPSTSAAYPAPAVQAEPPSSNAWNALTPADPQPDRVVPMTAEDERHMREVRQGSAAPLPLPPPCAAHTSVCWGHWQKPLTVQHPFCCLPRSHTHTHTQDLGRDPEQLLSKQTENVAHLQERRDQLNQAAPGQNLDEMAAAGGLLWGRPSFCKGGWRGRGRELPTSRPS